MIQTLGRPTVQFFYNPRTMAGIALLRGVLPQHFCKRSMESAVKVPQTRAVCASEFWVGRSALRAFSPLRSVHLCPAMSAGHNKWSKVKDVKLPKDAARGRLITKYAMMIRIAVKDGGPNPLYNAALANLIEQCRSKNIPKATIEGAIKGGKSKTGVLHMYEGRGPGGFSLLIEILTDNNTRSHQVLKQIMNKHGGVLSDGARHIFDKKGVVVALREGVSSDRALELAIEAGAEDVQETEDEEERSILQFICEMASTQKVRDALEGLGLHTLSASLEFVPHTPTVLPQAQLQAVSAFLEALNDCPEVVRVWDNIQAQD